MRNRILIIFRLRVKNKHNNQRFQQLIKKNYMYSG